MKLFLSGGGDSTQSYQIDKRFIESIDTTKPILYIPIAMPQESHSYPECLMWIKNNFKRFGFSNFIMWLKDDLKNKTETDFTQFGGVYIGGGNTFKLLKELKEFGTSDILLKLSERNIPLFGGSAGAIIWGYSISTAIGFDANDINLSDLSGFNKIAGYEIWCHYNDQSQKDAVKKYMLKYNLPKIIALPEEAGIIVSESSLEFVGNISSFIFEKDRIIEIKPGEIFKIKS